MTTAFVVDCTEPLIFVDINIRLYSNFPALLCISEFGANFRSSESLLGDLPFSRTVSLLSINPPPIHRTMLQPALRRTILSAFAHPARVNCLPRLAFPVARRGYADAPPSGELKLSLTVPHQSIFSNKEVYAS